jgi:hypothetical protein
MGINRFTTLVQRRIFISNAVSCEAKRYFCLREGRGGIFQFGGDVRDFGAALKRVTLSWERDADLCVILNGQSYPAFVLGDGRGIFGKRVFKLVI